MKLALTSAQRWPAAIIAVLVGQMAFGVWTARVAGSDPHFAVEPNYYDRAVNWDATMAQSRKDRALGWHANATLTRSVGTAATLHVSLTDSSGTPIVADSITADVLAIAHSDVIDRVTLSSNGAEYTGAVISAGNGLWEIQLRARRGADLFTSTLRAELR